MSGRTRVGFLLGVTFLIAHPAMAWDLVYPDGSKVPFEKVGLLRRSPDLLAAMTGLPPYANVVLAASTPPCPSVHSLSWTVGGDADKAGALSRCEADLAKPIQDLAPTSRRACKCEFAIEGQTQRGVYLRSDPNTAADPLRYVTARLVERGPEGTSEARGVYAFSNQDGSARLYNQDLKLSCTGKFETRGPKVQFDCGNGQVTGAGRYRRFASSKVLGGYYVLARFEPAPKTTIDIATNITDEELARLHPRFPDWP